MSGVREPLLTAQTTERAGSLKQSGMLQNCKASSVYRKSKFSSLIVYVLHLTDCVLQDACFLASGERKADAGQKRVRLLQCRQLCGLGPLASPSCVSTATAT